MYNLISDTGILGSQEKELRGKAFYHLSVLLFFHSGGERGKKPLFENQTVQPFGLNLELTPFTNYLETYKQKPKYLNFFKTKEPKCSR